MSDHLVRIRVSSPVFKKIANGTDSPKKVCLFTTMFIEDAFSVTEIDAKPMLLHGDGIKFELRDSLTLLYL